MNVYKIEIDLLASFLLVFEVITNVHVFSGEGNVQGIQHKFPLYTFMYISVHELGKGWTDHPLPENTNNYDVPNRGFSD